MPQDPYAAFGGSVLPPTPPPQGSADPYAQFGGTVSAQQPPPSLLPGTPNSGAAGRFAGGVAKSLNPIPGIKTAIDAASDPRQGAEKALKAIIYDPAADQFRKSSDAFAGRGEYGDMGPAGRFVSGVSHAAAGAVPLAGPAAANIGDTIGSGDVAGGLGELAGLALSEAVPSASRAVGRGAQRMAEPIAESALGISKNQRGFGKTPGRAALDETSGLKPETVAESARSRMRVLNSELEAAANASTKTGTLQNALDVIRKRSQKAAAGNSSATPKELAEMADQLTIPQPGFAGAIDPSTGMIAVDQSPANILRMKREFGKDFTKWNPLQPRGEMGTARQVYRELDKELDRTLPGSAETNQTISSLIPVAERGEDKALNAGITQNVMHRAAAHTGALASGIAGYHYGGPMGAVAGMVLPELAASPAVRMGAARSVNAAGKIAQSPYFTKPAQVAAAVNALRNNGDPLGLADFLK